MRFRIHGRQADVSIKNIPPRRQILTAKNKCRITIDKSLSTVLFHFPIVHQDPEGNRGWRTWVKLGEKTRCNFSRKQDLLCGCLIPAGSSWIKTPRALLSDLVRRLRWQRKASKIWAYFYGCSFSMWFRHSTKKPYNSWLRLRGNVWGTRANNEHSFAALTEACSTVNNLKKMGR